MIVSYTQGYFWTLKTDTTAIDHLYHQPLRLLLSIPENLSAEQKLTWAYGSSFLDFSRVRW